MDGSKTKTCKYLWAQMKYNDRIDDPISISIFVEMLNADTACYRISLEIKNDGANKETMERYHSHLDIPLNTDAELVYVAGSNKWGRPDKLKESQTEIKEKVSDGRLRKVQVSRFIEQKSDQTNEYFEQAVLNAVRALIPYYNHVIGKETDSYYPALSEYDPGITKEQWKEYITAIEIPDHPGSMRMLKAMMELGGEASCLQLSQLYGEDPRSYNVYSMNIGRRVCRFLNVEAYVREGTRRYASTPFLLRKLDKNEIGNYSFKLRPELYEALQEMDLSAIDLYYHDEVSKMVEFDKNMILYGPPGTGKTYNTVIYAVAICEGKSIDEVKDAPYADVMTRYEQLKKDGRVAFTTFHQSYGYEEFIEGIKPVVDEDESSLGYTIESGVFKKFCEQARFVEQLSRKSENDDLGLNSSPVVWKVSLAGAGDNETRTECLQNGHIRIGWDEYGEDLSSAMESMVKGKDILSAFVDKMQIGDFVLSCYSKSTIDAIGVVTGDYEWDGSYPYFNRVRKVRWIVQGLNENIVELNGGKTLTQATVYKLKIAASDVIALIDKLQESDDEADIETAQAKNSVFIIDEINRGNISKIFGELITLIEDTKREGMPEHASAILPYSGEKFSVPSNVYLLGTMNTADRSIALMDTALRRRFQFIEMMPDAQVLRDIGADKVEDLDVADMLDTINERITFLYDREHTIGHAFFTKLAESPTIETLRSIFQKSVIPLLQEYFYEDYQKIQLVLGDNGKTDPATKFILDEEVKVKSIFKGSVDEVVDLPEKKFTINRDAFSNIESYKQIM